MPEDLSFLIRLDFTLKRKEDKIRYKELQNLKNQNGLLRIKTIGR